MGQSRQHKSLPASESSASVARVGTAVSAGGARSAAVGRLNRATLALDLDSLSRCVDAQDAADWAYLQELFESVVSYQCIQFHIDADCSYWRLRYRCLDGYVEELIEDSDPAERAITTLRRHLQKLMPEHTASGVTRFCTHINDSPYELSLRIVPTIHGASHEFSIERQYFFPALLDQLGIRASQLARLREQISKRSGLIVLAGPEMLLLDDTLMAITQSLTSPERKVLCISDYHRYSLPRTTQIETGNVTSSEQDELWVTALNSHHDTIIIKGHAPHSANQALAQFCAHKGLVIQAIASNNARNILALQENFDTSAARLYSLLDSVIAQYPVRQLCPACKIRDAMDDTSNDWLASIRTPASENVIGWLSDGNTDRFLNAGDGCVTCDFSGYAGQLSVLDVISNELRSFRYGSALPKARSEELRLDPLLQQLMSLANAGEIPMQEAMRIMQLASESKPI